MGGSVPRTTMARSGQETRAVPNISSKGGAKDRTLYTVVITYPRFFPLWRFIGASSTTKLTASTILENQPYSDQNSYGAATVGHCT